MYCPPLSPPPSSPVSPLPTKPRVKSSITPRSFTRFFNPQIPQSNERVDKSSRIALGDITGPATNRQWRVGKRRSLKKRPITIFDEDENPESGSNNLAKAKKRAFQSPDLTPESASPLKRLKRSQRTNPGQNRALSNAFCPDSNDDAEKRETVLIRKLKPVERARYRNRLGEVSRREIGMPIHSYSPAMTYCSLDWQSQVSDFYSGHTDQHCCRNLVSANHEPVLPFCTAACNTNPLVAIGDEEGCVRILDSSKEGHTHFARPYLHFRPHVNAILDLEFSSDDRLLATASGDQTGQVVDMQTQKAIFELRGHASSVKQIRFQPSSNGNVLATSSRDGNIQLWDLRCKPASSPVCDISVSLSGALGDKPSTFSPLSGIKRAACVSLIPEAHSCFQSTLLSDFSHHASKQNILTHVGPVRKSVFPARNEISITALCFLSAISPHLLISGSESNATVKLWDIRMKQPSRSRQSIPLSATKQPVAHNMHRAFGLTSLAVNGDGSRLYTLCKDNTVYAYSTQHLILGSAPELADTWKPRRSSTQKEGLGPLYAFRHKKLKVSSFYVKTALRTRGADKDEMLAVGSTDACTILFPTNENFLRKCPPYVDTSSEAMPLTPASTPIVPRPSFKRYNSGLPAQRAHEDIPVFSNGASLVGGHAKEVTSMSWTFQGDLMTVGDDNKARVWREDPSMARSLRNNGDRLARDVGWICRNDDQGDDWDNEE